MAGKLEVHRTILTTISNGDVYLVAYHFTPGVPALGITLGRIFGYTNLGWVFVEQDEMSKKQPMILEEIETHCERDGFLFQNDIARCLDAYRARIKR